jgi:lambda family phage tail tape measure protein
MAESKAIFRIGGDASEFTAAIDVSIRKVDELTSATTKASQATAKNLGDQARAAQQDVLARKEAVKMAREQFKLADQTSQVVAKQALNDAQQALNETKKVAAEIRNQARAAADVARRQQEFDVQQALTATRLTKGAPAETELKASLAGFSTQESARFRAEQEKNIAANQKFGMSIRASGYAMSLIPAQMTDIVTQLAGGQSPFLIMVQQGGQLKDMFGGIGPAISAVGGYLAKMVNPATLAAAALGVVSYGFIKGAQDSEKLNKALILTGNFAGVTATQLGDMAETIAGSTGSLGKASNALVALTNAGRFTADQLEAVAKSVVGFSKATGLSAEEVAKQFASITEDPVKGIEKLNDKYNFLTAATYEQIKALVEQGNVQAATTLALDTFSEATDSMSKEVNANLGLIEKSWNAIKSAITLTTQAALSFGRESTTAQFNQQLDEIGVKLKKLSDQESQTGSLTNVLLQQKIVLEKQRSQILSKLSLTEIYNQDAAEKAAAQASQNKIIIDRKESEALLKSARTREQIRNDELEKSKRRYQDVSISYEEYQKEIVAINERYKDPQGRAVTDDAATRMLQNLREQEAAILAQLGTTEQLTSAEKEHAKFTQLIADLKEKSILTADQQSLQLRQEEILEQLNLNIAAENQLRVQKEINSVLERGKQITESIAQSELSRSQQYQNQLGAVGQGREAFDRIRQEADIRREFQKFQNQLSKGLSEGTLDTTQFDEQQAKINESLQVALGNFKKYYEDLDGLQANWALGARAGFADYAASARNAAQASSNLIGNAFKGMEDALVTFVKTGKLSFSSLVDSILSDLVRMSIQTAVTGPLAGVLKTFLSSVGTGGGLGGATTTGLGTTAGGAGATAFPVYADGGYTGQGDKYDVAGIVHRDEYVMNKEATQRIGVRELDRLNYGYANGGLVGGSMAAGLNQGAVNINIKNEASADGYQATATATRNESGLNIDVLVRRALTNDMKNNGPMAQSIGGAFGLRRTA